MDERSPLLYGQINNINDDQNSLPQLNKHFKWSVPSQETVNERKDRMHSIYLCYLCMFFSSVSYTITISSMWPFLQEIDNTANTGFLGLIVAMFSIGQLLSSPLFGFWSSQKRFHKIPILTSILLMILGNMIYFYLEPLDSLTSALSPKYWMLISRFVMGCGAACAAVVRAYISTATSVEERTGCLASLAACQGIGFIVGPVLQVAFVPIGYPGFKTSWLQVNLYTSPALLSIAIYLALFLTIFFKFNEYSVLTTVPRLERYDTSEKETDNLKSPDNTAICLTIYLFFLNCFIFSFFESIMSPLTIDMYAWSNKEATLYNGILIGVFGLSSVGVILIAKILVKRFKENLLMLVGFITVFLSLFCLISWGDNYPSIQIQTIRPSVNRSFTENTTLPYSTTTPEPRGCPIIYKWCEYTPKINFYQFLIAMLLMVIGYSISNVMSFAIFSKLQATNKPQGTMMGILTSFGSLARAVGPIIVTLLYQSYGHRACFISTSIYMFLTNILIIFTFKRFKPYSED